MPTASNFSNSASTQALLRHRARETTATRRQRRCSDADLEDFAAGDHRCRSVPNAGYAQLQPVVLRGEIELEIAIFLGVGRQFVGANIDLAPLETLANIPDRQKAGAPGREMIVLALRLTQPLTADPVVGRFAVAIGAGEIQFAELAACELLATLDRGF